ncbi:hypothetical protein KIL84_021429 [Mauremys mutica]|uniref:Uncharacterized protein n=1 Tax=Mauremys mutica TaxID=74926 RepID=A0A9D3X977_9SAUR|nr:hypothetical protein KIL84_021429 [Mauremys mutica]
METTTNASAQNSLPLLCVTLVDSSFSLADQSALFKASISSRSIDRSDSTLLLDTAFATFGFPSPLGRQRSGARGGPVFGMRNKLELHLWLILLYFYLHEELKQTLGVY